MKKQLLSLLILVFAPVCTMAQTVVEPGIKSKTTFAIIVDRPSYQNVRQAIHAYRDAIEADRLGTYIIYDDWESPAQIRAILEELHADGKAPLEGAVLVGDIPIPMLRDAQHLSSAFKMDQRRNWQQSSIPSDRYYDDFGLQFDFLKQDSLDSKYFYYSLRPDSEQFIESDIYTARIRPLEQGKADKYTQLDRYLRKVVSERTENPENALDKLSMGRGHGYNSESRASWAGEALALKEQFPEAFATGGNVRMMDFESRYPIKPYYLNEVMRPDLDLMLFHHHGSNYYQYLNGYKNGSDPNTSVENIKLYLRGKVLSAVEKGKSPEEAVEQYMAYLDVPRSWCEEAFDPELRARDSLFNLTLDINVDDILGIAPNARMVMFDACYNGSFYRDQYIAGAYIFNDGKTIVTQGNTVNTIQDKWPDLYIGLLAGGLRAGMWGKEVQFLETHIIGDPTFRFANTTLDFDINEAIALKAGDNKFWLRKTKHHSPDVQALAYAMLYRNGYPGLSQMLLDAYKNSPSFIVRMQAMTLLGKIDDHNFIEVLKLAVDDSYELVRRFAVEYIGKNGSDELIPAFVRSAMRDNTSERVAFKVDQYGKMLDTDKVIAEIDRQIENGDYYDTSMYEALRSAIARTGKSAARDLATITDPEATDKDKLQEIKSFRNHPAARGIEVLLAVAADEGQSADIRTAAAEALGWYTFSHRRADVVAGLNELAATAADPRVAAEALKSRNRLVKP